MKTPSKLQTLARRRNWKLCICKMVRHQIRYTLGDNLEKNDAIEVSNIIDRIESDIIKNYEERKKLINK